MIQTTYKGRKLIAKRAGRELNTLLYVNWQLFAKVTGYGSTVELLEVENMKRYVDDAEARPGAYSEMWESR